MNYFRFIFFLSLILWSCSFSANSQLIENRNGLVASDEYFFNFNSIKNRSIKHIKVSYSSKKSLKPIKKDHYTSVHFTFDRHGRLVRTYNTKLIAANRIDTTVEWRYYKDSLLQTIKKTGIGGINVKSIFYTNNKISTLIFGISQNSRPNKTILSVSSYKEQRAEYIEYNYLNKRDTLIKYRSVNGTVFQKKQIEWKDSATKTISFTHPLAPEKNKILTYRFDNKGKCTELEVTKSGLPTYRFVFQYSSSGFLTSFTKFDVNQNTSIEFSEIIYNEHNGVLQAIITKDLYDNTIFIKKYTYTYYD